ncbi:hypothetical protein [Capybara microvirus Cap3_SP_367]|nr:hypothetical protein [Capybara microvirus Cap3_SP_367]
MNLRYVDTTIKPKFDRTFIISSSVDSEGISHPVCIEVKADIPGKVQDYSIDSLVKAGVDPKSFSASLNYNNQYSMYDDLQKFKVSIDETLSMIPKEDL